MLRVRGLSKHFGGLHALSEVDMDVFDSEILGVIGPNGAGKTTLFNVVSGFLLPNSGQIIFDGKNIIGMKEHEIAQLGISRTFQASTLFAELSVLDNVFIGCHMSYKTSIWKRLLRLPSAAREEKTLKERAMEILKFMRLDTLKDEQARNLPHGYQKTLGVCAALATNPKLLLLDEPMTGMNQTEIQTMVDLIRQIRDNGVTIGIVEHNMKAVMNLCDRIVVLDFGKKIVEGLPKEIQKNKEVIEAYLGKAGAPTADA